MKANGTLLGACLVVSGFLVGCVVDFKSDRKLRWKTEQEMDEEMQRSLEQQRMDELMRLDRERR